MKSEKGQFPEIATREVTEESRESYIKEAELFLENRKKTVKDVEKQFKEIERKIPEIKTQEQADQLRQEVTELQQQYEKANRDIIATTGAIDEQKSEQGTYMGFLRNKFVESYTSNIDGIINIVFEAMAMIDPRMAGAGTREEALKNTREAVKAMGVKETLTNQLADGETTQQYIERLDRNILNQGIGGVAGSIFPMMTPAMTGFFAQSYDQSLTELEGADLQESEKRIYAGTNASINLLLERFGMSKVISGAPAVSKQIAQKLTNRVFEKAAKEANPTDEILGKIMKEEVSSFQKGFEKTGSRFLNSFLAEAETGATQQASEIALKAFVNNKKDKEIFKDLPKNEVEFVGTVAEAGAAEGMGGPVFGAVPAIAAGVAAGKPNVFTNLSDKDFDNLASKLKDPVYVQAIKDNLQAQVNIGEIAPEEANKALEGLGRATAVIESLPDDTPQKGRVADLMLQKLKIEQEAENAPDKTLFNQKKAKIDKQIKEITDPEEQTKKIPVSEETDKSTESKPIATKDPAERHHFTFKDESEIPTELRGIEPMSRAEVQVGKKKEIRLSFSGEQLIDAGIATEAGQTDQVSDQGAQADDQVKQDNNETPQETKSKETPSSEAEVLEKPTPESKTTAEKHGYTSPIHAVRSVNKRLGKEYQTIEEIPANELKEASERRQIKQGDKVTVKTDTYERGKKVEKTYRAEVKKVNEDGSFDLFRGGLTYKNVKPNSINRVTPTKKVRTVEEENEGMTKEEMYKQGFEEYVSAIKEKSREKLDKVTAGFKEKLETARKKTKDLRENKALITEFANDLLKGIEKKGVKNFPTRKVRTILNQIDAAKTPESVNKAADKLIELTQKIAVTDKERKERAQLKGLRRKNLSRLRNNDFGVGDGKIGQAIKVDPSELDKSNYNRFLSFMADISTGPFDPVKHEKDIQHFSEIFENQRQEAQRDLIPAEKTSPQTEKAKERKELADKQFKDAVKEPISPEDVGEAVLEDYRAIKDIADQDLEGLDATEVSELTQYYENIRSGFGGSTKAAKALRKVKANQIAAKATELTDGKSFKILLRDFLAPVKGTLKGLKGKTRTEKLSNYIRNTPLNRLDAILKGKKGEELFRTLVQPISSAYSKYTEVTNNLDKGYDRLYSKIGTSLVSAKREKQRQREMIKLSLIAMDKEHKSNPGNEEVSPIEDYISAIKEAAEKNESYEKLAEEYLEVYESMLTDGKFDYKVQEEKLAPDTKRYYEYTEGVHEANAEYVQVSAVRNGENITIRRNYTPVSVALTEYSNLAEIQEAAKDFTSDKDMPVTAKSNNIKKRTKGAKPIYLDYHTNSKRATRSVLQDYYMREPLRTVSQALNKIDNNKDITKEQRMFFQALEENLADVVRNVFVNDYYEGGLAVRFLNTVKKRGYQMALASVPRSGVEMFTNFSHAMLFKPFEIMDGISAKILYDNKTDDFRKLTTLAGSSQISRLFEKGQSIMAEQGSSTQGSSTAYGRLIDKWNDYLVSQPDRLVAKPLWLGSFIRTFESVTGEKLDVQKMVNDKEYREKHKYAIRQARDKADSNLSQSMASLNPFEGIVAAQVTKDENIVKTFDKYMTRFMRYEFQSMVDAFEGLVNLNHLSRREAGALLGATVVRMAAYQFMLGSIVDLTYQGVEMLMGTDVDEEDEDDTLDKLNRSILGTAMSLFLFRRLGNLGKLPIAYGVELLNKGYGEEAGLREGEYDSYQHQLLFNPVPVDNDHKSTEAVLVRLLGPYSPVAKTISRGKTVVDMGGVPNPAGEGYLVEPKAKEQETIDKYNRELVMRILPELYMELAGVPAPRDVRNLLLREVFKEYREKAPPPTSNSNNSFRIHPAKIKPTDIEPVNLKL